MLVDILVWIGCVLSTVVLLVVIMIVLAQVLLLFSIDDYSKNIEDDKDE